MYTESLPVVGERHWLITADKIAPLAAGLVSEVSEEK